MAISLNKAVRCLCKFMHNTLCVWQFFTYIALVTHTRTQCDTHLLWIFFLFVRDISLLPLFFYLSTSHDEYKSVIFANIYSLL